MDRLEERRVYTRVEAFNERTKVGEGRHVQALVRRGWLASVLR